MLSTAIDSLCQVMKRMKTPIDIQTVNPIENLELLEGSHLKVISKHPMLIVENVLTGLHSDNIKIGHNSEQVVYHDTDIKNIEQLQIVLDASARLLTSEGFRIDSKYWFIESHIDCVNTQKVSSPFSWHQDDYGGWSEKRVNTVLWYVRKDETLMGGNLLWTDQRGNVDWIVGPQNAHRLMVENGMIVMMRGDLWHCPEEIEGGTGIRKLLVVQYRALD